MKIFQCGAQKSVEIEVNPEECRQIRTVLNFIAEAFYELYGLEAGDILRRKLCRTDVRSKFLDKKIICVTAYRSVSSSPTWTGSSSDSVDILYT